MDIWVFTRPIRLWEVLLCWVNWKMQLLLWYFNCWIDTPRTISWIGNCTVIQLRSFQELVLGTAQTHRDDSGYDDPLAWEVFYDLAVSDSITFTLAFFVIEKDGKDDVKGALVKTTLSSNFIEPKPYRPFPFLILKGFLKRLFLRN